MHAQIKLRPLIEDGAYHVFTSLKLNNDIQLSPKERKAVVKKLTNNSYFAHPEAIIVGSLGEKLVHVLLKLILSYEALVSCYSLVISTFNQYPAAFGSVLFNQCE